MPPVYTHMGEAEVALRLDLMKARIMHQSQDASVKAIEFKAYYSS